MAGIRALQKRVARLERADMPQRSPFAIWFGSFELFVELTIWPGIVDGSLDKLEMIDIVAALRRWEDNGTWDRAVVE